MLRRNSSVPLVSGPHFQQQPCARAVSVAGVVSLHTWLLLAIWSTIFGLTLITPVCNGATVPPSADTYCLESALQLPAFSNACKKLLHGIPFNCMWVLDVC
jgi:hypothetical protein